VASFVFLVAARTRDQLVVALPIQSALDDPLRQVRGEVTIDFAFAVNAGLPLTLAFALSGYVLPKDPMAIVEEDHFVLEDRTGGFFNELVQDDA